MKTATEIRLRGLWSTEAEVCGFVMKDGSVVRLRNAAQNPARNFSFDTQGLLDFLEVHRVEDVDGIFHTHPSNRPSPTDCDLEGWPRLNIRYFVVTRYRVYEWIKNDDGSVSPAPGQALADPIRGTAAS